MPAIIQTPRVSASPEVNHQVTSFLSKLCQWIAEVIKDSNSLKGKLFEIDVALDSVLFARDFDSRCACLRRLCQVLGAVIIFDPFRGRIDLFRTEDVAPVEFYELDPLLGWSGMALEGIEVHELSGRHGDYLREPQDRDIR